MDNSIEIEFLWHLIEGNGNYQGQMVVYGKYWYELKIVCPFLHEVFLIAYINSLGVMFYLTLLSIIDDRFMVQPLEAFEPIHQ
jgi:hypothetical protein